VSLVNLPPTAKMVAAGFNKPKPPKLAEVILFLFGEELQGAHDAMVDVRATARVHFHLQTIKGKAA
jgi:DNA polymerase III subunit epsilon